MYQDSNILPFPETVDSKLQAVMDAHYQGDDVFALKKCLSLIDDGYSEAYVFAGAFYEKGGNGIDPDYQKSRFYYEKSIEERGAVEAYLGIARIYYYGLGVDQDYCKARSFYEKVTRESNNPVASLMLGKIYQDGLCGEKELDKARELYKRAWDCGHILGLTYLGLLEQQSGNYMKGLMLRIKAGYLGFKAAGKNPHDPRLRTS
jgi:TPR repeat protein